MPYSAPNFQSLSLEEIIALSEHQESLPVDQWNPQKCSDSKMCILPDGRWFHDGGELKRKSMIRAFSSLLRKDKEDYWLVTPYEKQSIIVKDAPFLEVEIKSEGHGENRKILIRLNDDYNILIGSHHKIIMQHSNDIDSIPYIEVRHGLMAKCTRSVTYELYEIALQESHATDGAIGLWSDGCFFDLNCP